MRISQVAGSRLAGGPARKDARMFRLRNIVFPICLMIAFGTAMAQTPPPARPTPPTRDPHTPGYVTAKELPDGINAPADADGNFIIGPTHNPVPEMTVTEGVPQGTVYNFTMNSADSKLYPGIARDRNSKQGISTQAAPY